MKEFFDLLDWKSSLTALLSLIIIRISIIIPFYNQFSLLPDDSLEFFVMTAFGICFLLSAMSVAVRFDTEKRKIFAQTHINKINLKEYPDIQRLFGLAFTLAFIGSIAIIYAGMKNNALNYHLALLAAVLVLGIFYTVKARRMFLTGNLVLALLYALIIFWQYPEECWEHFSDGVYKPIPDMIDEMKLLYLFIFLSAMVFVLTLIRDITGDVTNIKDDKQLGYSTFAVKAGESKSKTLLYCLSVLFIVMTVVFVYLYRTKLDMIQIFITAAIMILPVVYYIVMLNKASKQTDYNFLYILMGMMFISLLFVISFCKNLFINGYIL